MDDEIDLRAYLQVMIDWWREICLFTLAIVAVTALVVVALKVFSPPVYEASATIAIARVKSDISFDERYRTLSEEELQMLRGDARRSALLGLVVSSAVAEVVIDDLGSMLPEEAQNPAVLLKWVTAEVVTLDARDQSDLIRISVVSDDPALSANIANAWARHYVVHVNRLYGGVPLDLIESVKADLAKASVDYEAAQDNLEKFIAEDNTSQLDRMIAEKESIIASIQLGKQSAVQSLIDKEIAARQQLAGAYLDALAQNRLLAFQKEQDAKQQVVEMYIDTEIQNRLTAFLQDRQAREEIYNRLIAAELESVITVFDEQLQAQLMQLPVRYEEKQRLEGLLANTRSLEAQVAEGGDAAAATNGLALTLLKTQIFASSAPMPGQLQLNLDAVAGGTLTAAEQQADLAALIGVLTSRIDTLEAEINDYSEQLATGGSYLFLDKFAPEQLAAATSAGSTGGVQAETDSTLRTLHDAIGLRYQDLYNVGQLAETGQQMALDSELFDEIRTLYPDLFKLDELAKLGEDVTGETPLALLSESQGQQLLQLQGLEELASYGVDTKATNQSMAQMETELQDLRAQLEARHARAQQLQQQRDLAWSTFTTLSNKNAELTLSNTAANSEVRFASPAISPVESVEDIDLLTTLILAGLIGQILAVFIVFLANFMGAEPPLRSRSTPANAPA